MSETITLYVDGACRGNGKDGALGGWGAYIVTEHEERKIFGGETQTTNNRMELTAAISTASAIDIERNCFRHTGSSNQQRKLTEANSILYCITHLCLGSVLHG